MVAPMVIAAGVTALGSILGGKGAAKASKAQLTGTREGLALEERLSQQQRSDLAPWREAGGRSLGMLEAMLQPGYDHTTSPGYQFRLAEGNRNVENSAAARGVLQSGGTLRDLIKIGQGYAAADFNDDWNRKAGLAGVGQTTASTLAQLTSQSAQRQGDLITGGANARASGYVGQANAAQAGLSNLALLAMMNGNGSTAVPKVKY